MKDHALLLIILIGLAGSISANELLLSEPTQVDPSEFDFRDLNGPRAIPESCTLKNGLTVTADDVTGKRQRDLTVRVSSPDGMTASFTLEHNGMNPRAKPLACDPVLPRFYVGHQIPGIVYAYDANLLLNGDAHDGIVWKHEIRPWTTIDEAGFAGMSYLTRIIADEQGVLVEWYERPNGVQNYRFRVFTPDGSTIGTLGNSDTDFLLKTDDGVPGWELFQGGGQDPANYVPRRVYNLTVGNPTTTMRLADEVVKTLALETASAEMAPIVSLNIDPRVEHMIALMTPPRTARRQTEEDPIISVCSATKPDRARHYLGRDFDMMLAKDALRVLQQFSAEVDPDRDSVHWLDGWFRREHASNEWVQALVETFDPLSDEWVINFMSTLSEVAGPALNEAVADYSNLHIERL